MWRVPPPAEESKHERGRVLVVGGSRETPGAVLLAARAAQRVGAGVVQIATAASAATAVAVALPETRVVPLREVGDGGAVVDDGETVGRLAARVDAVLVGSGTLDASATESLLRGALGSLASDAVLVVDASALAVVAEQPDLLDGLGDRIVLMPNLGEASRMAECSVDAVRADGHGTARALVRRFGCVVAVRGTETWIGAPGVPVSCHRGGHPLLGVAGSGDVLAGALAGLAGRGCAPLVATECAVLAHARCGETLAASGPPVGRVAGELVDVLARVVAELDRRSTKGSTTTADAW